jgi:HlyD family secretion protein
MSLPVLPPKPPTLQLLLIRARQALIALTPERLKAVKLAHWLWIAAAALLVVFFAWMLWPRAQVVEIARIDRGEVRRDIVDEGRTRIHDVFTIAAPVSGALQRINLEPGDFVMREQVVATIAPAAPALLDARVAAEAAANVATAQSSLVAAQAELGLAQRDQDRVARLHAQGFASTAALDASNANLSATRAQVAARRSEVARARAAAGAGAATVRTATAVRSPASGRVLRLMQQSEGVVAIGTPLMEIGDPRNMEIVAEFLSQDTVDMRVDARAFIENWGGRQALPAHVTRIEPYAHTKISALGVEEQRVNVILRLDSPDSAPPLGHAFRVDVRVVAAELQNSVRVPTDALIRSGQGWAVFRIVDGRARMTPVEIGEGGDRYRGVVHGLLPGNVVIVFPGDALRDGARVRGQAR